MKLTATVDLIEVVWTLASLIGLALALDLLGQARYDRLVVRSARPAEGELRRRWDLECSIVAGDVASAWWIVAQELVSVMIGVVALATPSPPGGRTAFGWAVVVGLLLIALMLPARLFGQRRRRRELGIASYRSDRPRD